MSNKERWVDLFEQVVGRKPKPDEFLAGRDSGFDFKLIKTFLDDRSVDAQVDLENQTPSDSQERPNSASTSVVQTTKQTFFLKHKLIALLSLVLFGLIGGYYYLYSQTGLDVAVEAFSQAVKAKNYTVLADILSSDGSKWSNSQAKSFVSYLENHFDNLDGDLEAIVSSEGKLGLTDTNDNVLVTFEPSYKTLGLFQNYQARTHGIDVKVRTNLSQATASLDGGKSVSLAKDQETVVKGVHFAAEELDVKGKTEVGPIESLVVLDLDKVKDNQLVLDLMAVKEQVNISLPLEASSAEQVELVVNGKKIAAGLTGEVEVLSGQDLEVYSNFTVNGKSYMTNKTKVVVGQDSLDLTLDLSSDTKKGLDDTKKAKEAEAKKAKGADEKRQAVLWSFDKQEALARYMVEFGQAMGQPNYQRIPITRKIIWSGVELDSSYQIVDGYEYWYNNGQSVHRYIFVIKPNGEPVVLYSEDTGASDYYITRVTQNDVLPSAFYDIVY